MTIPVVYFAAFLVLLLAQALLTPTFLKAEIPEPCIKSLVFKMCCSTVFVATAVIAVICSGNYSFSGIAMLVGFGFSWLGDFLLHVRPRDPIFFTLGLVSFLCGHLCYITAYTKAAMFYFPDAPFIGIPEMFAYICLICFALFSLNNFKVEFGDMYLPCLIYMNVIAIMLVKAVSLAIRIVAYGQTDNPIFTAVMLVFGAALFVISDYTLAILTFVKGVTKHGTLRNINIWTYFFGQMLLAFTTLYIIPA